LRYNLTGHEVILLDQQRSGIMFKQNCDETTKMISRGSARLRFISRLIDGESMSDVCREFGISRKTDTRSTVGTGSL
jgi:hypothetical protein